MEFMVEVQKKNIYILLEKKNTTLREKDIWKRRKKLADYVISKGYESFLVKLILFEPYVAHNPIYIASFTACCCCLTESSPFL